MMRFDCRGLSTEDLAKSEQVQQAYNCLVKNGYAILDHVLPEDKVRDMNLEFNRRYTKYLQNQELEDTRKVGNRRFMVPIDLSGAFGDPLVYAHPFVVAVVRKALDLDAILESFGAVISLPGARAQHIHRDGRLLFDAAIRALGGSQTAPPRPSRMARRRASSPLAATTARAVAARKTV